jgi:hypothetical protein
MLISAISLLISDFNFGEIVFLNVLAALNNRSALDNKKTRIQPCHLRLLLPRKGLILKNEHITTSGTKVAHICTASATKPTMQRPATATRPSTATMRSMYTTIN